MASSWQRSVGFGRHDSLLSLLSLRLSSSPSVFLPPSSVEKGSAVEHLAALDVDRGAATSSHG
eukprot:7179154-Alexandrium_andersonii.AAC.1